MVILYLDPSHAVFRLNLYVQAYKFTSFILSDVLVFRHCPPFAILLSAKPIKPSLFCRVTYCESLRHHL